jgi:hypothetical protein
MSRTAALLVWLSTLVVPLFFGAMAQAIRAGSGLVPESAFFFWMSVLVSALCIALAHLLPARIRPVPAGREATAFIRLVSGWALCEGAAFLPLLAWTLTDDPRLLGVCAVDLLALVTLFPSESRWASLLPGQPSPARRCRP